MREHVTSTLEVAEKGQVNDGPVHEIWRLLLQVVELEGN
jgi:hypothetical protein